MKQQAKISVAILLATLLMLSIIPLSAFTAAQGDEQQENTPAMVIAASVLEISVVNGTEEKGGEEVEKKAEDEPAPNRSQTQNALPAESTNEVMFGASADDGEKNIDDGKKASSATDDDNGIPEKKNEAEEEPGMTMLLDQADLFLTQRAFTNSVSGTLVRMDNQPSATPIIGYDVYLFQPDDLKNPVYTVATAASMGTYTFSNIFPGRYRIGISAAGEDGVVYELSAASAQYFELHENGNIYSSNSFEVGDSGTHSGDAYNIVLGIKSPEPESTYTISGGVWYSTTQDPFPVAAGHRVHLYHASDANLESPVKDAVTDESGAYSFADVPVGEYRVAISATGADGAAYKIPESLHNAFGGNVDQNKIYGRPFTLSDKDVSSSISMEFILEIAGVIVKFDAPGSNFDEIGGSGESRVYNLEDSFGKDAPLPEPYHEDVEGVHYQFDGWYAVSAGASEAVTNESVVGEVFFDKTSGTLHAKWLAYHLVTVQHVDETDGDSVFLSEADLSANRVSPGEAYTVEPYDRIDIRGEMYERDGATYAYTGRYAVMQSPKGTFSGSGTLNIDRVEGDWHIIYDYHKMDTTIELTWPQTMSFEALPSTRGAITADLGRFENNSDFPLEVFFVSMMETHPVVNLTWKEAAQADGDYELTLILPADTMEANAFSDAPANGSNIQPDTTVNWELGTLKGHYLSECYLSNKGYITLGGQYIGPFYRTAMQPILELNFHFELITD